MRRTRVASLLTLFVLTFGVPRFLQAEAKRTFVSGAGSDANPCSITSPCRSFSQAIQAVADGGEIVALDSAGYGAVTVNKSVKITAPEGIYAGITTTNGEDGVRIVAAGVRVSLKGLKIHNPVINPGQKPYGIWMYDGSSLVVDRCEVTGFDTGISINAGNVLIRNSVVSQNQFGIEMSANSAGGLITDCAFEGNDMGLYALQETTVSRSEFTGNQTGCYASGSGGKAQIAGCTFTENNRAIHAVNSGLVRVEGTSITANAVGLTASSANIYSRLPASNTVEGNTTNGAFTGTYPAK